MLTCLFAATALFSVGCDDSTGLSDSEAANVRVFNASPTVGNIDILIDDDVDTDASDVPFLNASPCLRVDADESGLTLDQTGGSIGLPTTQDYTFTEGGRNTVIVSGTTAANLRITTIDDPLEPELDDDEARIRVFNGRTVTTLMDAHIQPWSQTSATIEQDLNTTDNPVSDWVEVPAGGPVEVRITNANSATVISSINIIPREGEELTLVVVDAAAGAPAVRFGLTSACSAP
jgi:hypothetical protein